MKHPLYFQWSISTLFGWGVYGLNLLRYWQAAAGSPAYSIGQIDIDSLRGMDPLALRILAQPLVDSDQVRLQIAAEVGNAVELDGVVLHSLGNNFAMTPGPNGATIRGGIATAGVIFFEDTTLSDAKAICGDYDLIVTGSSWCEEILRSRGVANVATVIQGIDPSLFHPAPRSGALEDRFAVFSGGKIEHRKGQDLVLLAFRAFAQRHPEAILVTAWHSPWATPALTVNVNPDIAPIALTESGTIDMAGWVAANGIAESQYLDIGQIPNHLMARVIREMDVGLFPNRCEGGTNLVAMECMACGIPSIVSHNTGHKDLTVIPETYSLRRQGPVRSAEGGTEGWGESDIDEIVDALEQVWTHREEARRRGRACAEAMAKLSWRDQIASLHQTLSPLSG